MTESVAEQFEIRDVFDRSLGMKRREGVLWRYLAFDSDGYPRHGRRLKARMQGYVYAHVDPAVPKFSVSCRTQAAADELQRRLIADDIPTKRTELSHQIVITAGKIETPSS